MSQNIFENEIIPPQRPVFLKVLCMLTFIWSGYSIINSTVTYFKADAISKLFVDEKAKLNEDLTKKKSKDKTENINFFKNVMSQVSEISTPENLRRTAIGNLLTSLFCLSGAVLMWYLKRAGFYIYTLGTIISIVLPFYMFGSNFVTNLSAGFLGFIGLLFVIFYAMNLKSMK